MKSTVTLYVPQGVDPFANQTSKPAKSKVQAFILFLRAMVVGGILGRAASRPTLVAGTVHAKAIVTCAAVVNANTVTLNGTQLLATQFNATGTVTCTASGIDVADTVTINTTGILTARQHFATGTVTFANTPDSGDDVEVAGVTFVATAGAVTLGDATYSIDTGTTECATSLKAQINAHEDTLGLVICTSASAVVTIKALASGVGGNAITLTSVDATDSAVTGSGFLAGAVAVAANEFDITLGTDSSIAATLNTAINASTLLSGIVTSVVATNVVTVRAYAAGTAGDSIGLASSDAQLAVSAATLTGGAAITNNAFDFTGSAVEECNSLVAAINASSTALVSDHVKASNYAGTVLCATVLAGDWVEIAGVRLRAVTAAVADSKDTFTIITSDTAVAAALVVTINAHPVLRDLVFASNSSGTVTLRQLPFGTGISTALFMTSSGGTLSVTQFARTSVAHIVAVRKGTDGNQATIASSGSTLAIGGSVSRLAGGTDAALSF